MFLLLCRGCGATNTVACSCPPGHTAAYGVHLARCEINDIGTRLACVPGSDCCQADHDHDAAANACPADHSDAPCPHPDPAQCPVDGQGRGGDPDAACGGGHHGKGVDGCTVCRPITILAIGGMVPAGPGVN